MSLNSRIPLVARDPCHPVIRGSIVAVLCHSFALVCRLDFGGTFSKQGGGKVTFWASFNNSGTVEVQGGTLTFNSGLTQTAGQTVLRGGSISANSPLQIQGGLVGGIGTINASVNSSGTLSPGTSPGLLTITGDYIQTAAGTMAIELAGQTPVPGSTCSRSAAPPPWPER
jgi:hypothetical protein